MELAYETNEKGLRWTQTWRAEVVDIGGNRADQVLVSALPGVKDGQSD